MKIETRKIYDFYAPIEIDYSIPFAEKNAHMLTWWESNLKRFSSVGLSKDDFIHLVLESRLLFRNGLS